MAKGRKTGGRKAGTRNKFTTALKDVIVGGLSDAGGQAWLAEQARKNPVPFMALIGRVLPLQVPTLLRASPAFVAMPCGSALSFCGKSDSQGRLVCQIRRSPCNRAFWSGTSGP